MPTPPSLVTRLFLLVALALLPAVILLGVLEMDLRAERTAAARDQALRLARDASARLGRFVEGLREALVVLAEAPSIRQGDPAGCTAMLGQLRERFDERIILGAMDREGWVYCTTRNTPAGVIYDGDRPFFRDAVETDRLGVSEWKPSTLLGGGSIHFGLAVRGGVGERHAGAVGAAVAADLLARLLQPIGLPPGGVITVVDREDKVLLRLSAIAGDPVRAGQPVPPMLLRILPPVPGRAGGAEVEAAGAVLDGHGIDGRAKLFGVMPFVPGTGGAMRLVVSLDTETTMASVERASRRGLLLIGIGLVVALAAAWFGARRFVLRPIATLLEGAERWGHGDYAMRVAPALSGSTPELLRLGGALDRMAEAAEGRDRASAALRDEQARLALALEAGRLAVLELNPGSGRVTRSARRKTLFGIGGQAGDWTWPGFLRQVLPEDRLRVTRVFRQALAGEGPLSADFRIRRGGDGALRWLEARGSLHRTPDGARLLGVLVDVTERRQAEQRLRLTVGELNHRVKNTLAAVQSIANQTLRAPAGEAVPAAARQAFEARLLALARSHDLLTREGWSGANLAELVRLALAPHGGGQGSSRLLAEGPPVRVPPRHAVPLSIALHELATNAARHGALSRPEGRVLVRWSLQGMPAGDAAPRLELHWEESGGPPLAGPPQRRGFGTRLLERGLARELGGTVTLDFAPAGLRCAILVPLPAAALPAEAEREAAE